MTVFEKNDVKVRVEIRKMFDFYAAVALLRQNTYHVAPKKLNYLLTGCFSTIVLIQFNIQLLRMLFTAQFQKVSELRL